MELLPIITLFSVLFVASNAALSPEAYWNSVLPNTAMPNAIKDLLNSEEITSMSHRNHGILYAGAFTNHFKNAASDLQMHDFMSRAIFILEKDLKPGKSTSFGFPKSEGDGKFLARSDAEKLPFSSDKMSQILDLYNVSLGSQEDLMMRTTIKECEAPAVKGEEKSCVTSLESMIDFSTSKLGKQVRAISSKVDEKETKLRNYTIVNVTMMRNDKVVVCHKQPYPYAVFYCHSSTRAIRAYKIFMTSAQGSKGETVAVCHIDTSDWYPKHLVFQVLKVQPGTVPVCHFIPEDHIVWVAN